MIKNVYCQLLMILLLASICYAQVSKGNSVKNFTLANLHGKNESFEELLSSDLTVLIFWSTWEGDSGKYLSRMQQFYDKYKDKGFRVVGVCSEQQKISDEKKKTIQEQLAKEKISFTILFDNDLQVFRLYNVIAIPTTVLIDKSKIIISELFGTPLIETERLFEIISRTFEPELEKKKETTKKDITKPVAIRDFNLANLEFKKGYNGSAKKHVEEAILADSLFLKPYLLLFELLISEKQFDAAEKILKKEEIIDPSSDDVIIQKCYFLTVKEKYNEAISSLNEFVKKNSSNALAHAYLGYAYGMKKYIDKAMLEFSVAESLDSLDYRIHLLKSEVFSSNGMGKEALKELSKAKRK